MSKREILQRLTQEVTASGIAKAAAVTGALALAAKQWKVPPPSRFSQRSSALEYAKLLVKAKDEKQTMTAVVGLLNMCGRILLKTQGLRDLGHAVMKVVNSERLETFFDE